jgi:hypothetical protein
MYAISTDEEQYEGSYETVEDAIEDAANGYAHEVFWVGKCVPPPQPESMWRADDWLEHVSCQDSYAGDYAECWDDSTAEQQAELENEVQAVMAAWLDRHKLRPRFFLVEDAVKYVVVDGKPVKASDALV